MTWKTVFLLSGKVCEIIDENVEAAHFVIEPSKTQYMFNHHK